MAFPDPRLAEDGLLAVGGDLSVERLLLAYASGIFPWYDESTPILWHSPDPRMVLLTRERHIPRSLRKSANKLGYEVRVDTAFAEVIARAARAPRPGQDGTWITREMQDAYVRLHEEGFAHSFETYADGELVGGLYGVSLGAAYFGESMFAEAPDASKVAFTTALEAFEAWGIELVDCQVYTEHLARFGATEWPRERFLAALGRALEAPTRRGRWALGAAG